LDCPNCGENNFEGADSCESCGTTLVRTGVPPAKGSIKKRLLEEKVANLNLGKPVCVKPSDHLKVALDVMKEKNLGCVLVEEKKSLVGIFTERDALTKLGRSTVDIKKAKVKEYMTPGPEFLEKNYSLAHALNKMSVGGYRHLPVMENGKIAGLVSIRDILNYFWS